MQVYAADNLAFTVGSNVNATRGGIVTVPITVSNNPGFAATGLIVTYDPNVLEITGVATPVASMPLNSQFALTSTPGTQWIHLVNTNLVDWKGNGIVVNMTFNVKSTAPVGTSSVTLAFTGSPDGTPANANGDIINTAEIVSGSVNITASAGNALTFTADSNVAAVRGGTVMIPITSTNNPGFAAVGFVVTYDPNVLEISSVSAPLTAMPLNSQFALTSTPGTQWIHLVNTSLTDWNGNGALVYMTFRIKSAAPLGLSSINLTFTSSPNGTPGNANGNILTNAVVVSGSVNVVNSTNPPDGGGYYYPPDNGNTSSNSNNNSGNNTGDDGGTGVLNTGPGNNSTDNKNTNDTNNSTAGNTNNENTGNNASGDNSNTNTSSTNDNKNENAGNTVSGDIGTGNSNSEVSGESVVSSDNAGDNTGINDFTESLAEAADNSQSSEIPSHLIKLQNGWYVEDLGDGLYLIFDENRVPLGYVQLKDGEDIKQWSDFNNLIPLDGLHPMAENIEESSGNHLETTAGPKLPQTGVIFKTILPSLTAFGLLMFMSGVILVRRSKI